MDRSGHALVSNYKSKNLFKYSSDCFDKNMQLMAKRYVYYLLILLYRLFQKIS